jgi:hypothetical protein
LVSISEVGPLRDPQLIVLDDARALVIRSSADSATGGGHRDDRVDDALGGDQELRAWV